MDCCVRVFFGGIVRREDGMFENMEEELEWFDEPPSFNDLCVHLNAKFGDDFTLQGRFDTSKTRARYVMMPLRDPAHWSRYNWVLLGSNVPMAVVVVENGYRLQGVQDGSSINSVGGSEQELGVKGEATQGNMDLDSQLTQEQFHSSQVSYISNDFDVNEFERKEEEQEEEDRIGDVVSSDSDNSDDDQGGRHDMTRTVDAMPVPIHGMPLPVPTEALHGMSAQDRLVTYLPADDTPYDSWGRISEAR
jgi:hypothetical protein